MKRTDRDEYSVFHSKLTRRVCGSVALSVFIVAALYRLLWKRRMGDVIVWFLVHVLNMSRQEAFYFYADHFRLNKDLFFCGAVFLIFAFMLWRVFRGMSRYFGEINRGIESLLADDGEQIRLSPEMLPFERKLNAVKRTLAERKEETAQAERRKDELVMYLAHDIRTPLTSVIGYLNLLEEEPDSPPEQRAKRVRIALDKAYRLDQARSTGTGGTGLGLAIAKEIVLLHGGSIQASSENHTVTFTIRLPGGRL